MMGAPIRASQRVRPYSYLLSVGRPASASVDGEFYGFGSPRLPALGVGGTANA